MSYSEFLRELLKYSLAGAFSLGLVWRHLEYDLGSDAELAEIELDGPAAEFEFTW